jgi:hypothetical protein
MWVNKFATDLLHSLASWSVYRVRNQILGCCQHEALKSSTPFLLLQRTALGGGGGIIHVRILEAPNSNLGSEVDTDWILSCRADHLHKSRGSSMKYATHNSLQDKLTSARVNLGPTPPTTGQTPPSHQATPVDVIEFSNHLPFNVLLIYSHVVHHTGSRLAKQYFILYIKWFSALCRDLTMTSTGSKHVV